MSGFASTRRHFLVCIGAFAGIRFSSAFGQEAGASASIAPQPYFAGVNRAIEALAKLGSPVTTADAQQIVTLARQSDGAAVEAAEKVLGRYTLADLLIASDGSAQVALGGAPRKLIEQGWSVFLVRVSNPQGRTDNIWFSSGWGTPGQMGPADHSAQRAGLADTLNKAPAIGKMWLLSELYETTPILRFGQELPVVGLSGSLVEYHVIQLYSRDHGQRRADLTVYTLPKSDDGSDGSGHREFTFECLPSRTITL